MSDFDALATVLQSPYFSRIWIIQEILLNPTKPFLLCGDTKLVWQHVTFFTRMGGWIDELLRRHVPSSAIFLIAGGSAAEEQGEKSTGDVRVLLFFEPVHELTGQSLRVSRSRCRDYNKSVLESVP